MIRDTFDYVQQQAERQIQEFFSLMQLGQVDLSAVFGCGIQLLITVSVCQPHHLGKKMDLYIGCFTVSAIYYKPVITCRQFLTSTVRERKREHSSNRAVSWYISAIS